MSTCGRCFKEISEGQVVNAQKKTYHTECFVCTQCRCKLAGKDFRTKMNSAYCEECYSFKFQPRCANCHKTIAAAVKYSVYKEKAYHPDCFICLKCRKSLQGEQFTELEGKLKCMNCAK